MPIPPPAAAVFATHHGCASTEALLAVPGVTRHVIAWWRRSKTVRPVHHGVVRVAGAPVTPELRLWAALLRCGSAALAGGQATCWLLGLEGFAKPVIDVVLAAPHRARGTSFPAVTRKIDRADRSSIRGFPTLSPVRAVIEVAPALPAKQLRVLIDSARRKKLIDIEALRARATELLDAPGSRRGAQRVLALLGSGDLAQESENEREMAEFLSATDLELEWQVRDILPGRRLDAVDRAALLIIELDSRLWHTLGSDRDADGLRDLEVAEHDSRYVVFRLTLGMVRFDAERTRALLNSIRQKRVRTAGAAERPV